MTQREGREHGSSGQRDMPAVRGAWHPASSMGGGPFAMMRRISDEFDRIFESFGMGGGLPSSPWQQDSGGMRTLWAPHIEVCRRGDKLLVQADLPGVRREDVDVDIEDDRIVLHGHRSQEETREEGGVLFSERSYGSFHRIVPLPEGVSSDEAKATFRDGVLTIELPAPRERQRGLRLKIQESSDASDEGARSTGGPAGAQSGAPGTSV